jgi:hypothetical protein
LLIWSGYLQIKKERRNLPTGLVLKAPIR